MSRYALHEQVYLHKTTRCIETMIGKLLRSRRLPRTPIQHRPGQACSRTTSCCAFSPFGDTLDNYLALDDLAVTGSLERMQQGADPVISDLAGGFGNGVLQDAGHRALRVRPRETTPSRPRIDLAFEEKLENGAVIKDETASVGIYTPVGGDRTHNKLHILDAGRPREISEMSKVIETLAIKRQFTRYYFAESSDRDAAVEEGR